MNLSRQCLISYHFTQLISEIQYETGPRAIAYIYGIKTDSKMLLTCFHIKQYLNTILTEDITKIHQLLLHLNGAFYY